MTTPVMESDLDRKNEEIRAHWEDVAVNLVDKDGLKRTIRDHNLQEALEEAMLSHMKVGDRLLDVGSGDGSSTAIFARKTQAPVVAVDYVEGFCDLTRQNLAAVGAKDVTVLQGDARQLDTVLKGIEPVDVALSIRCLINFPTHEEQFAVAEKTLDFVKSGGLYMLSEGWAECWDALDEMRERCGLPRMHLVHHNVLINKAELIERLAPKAELVAEHSLGFYSFLSRVFQPMVVAPEAPKHMHPINVMAKKLSSLGIAPAEFDALGYPGICVFRKK